MRDKGLDYFENSRRATYVQREYAIRNPLEFASYHEDCWGVTTSGRPRLGDAPDDGVERLFFAYRARRAPYGPDDGTLSPWAVLASLPFVPPEIVLSACRHFEDMDLGIDRPYGFKASFNLNLPGGLRRRYGWISPWHFGLNQGPIVLMIENYRTASCGG